MTSANLGSCASETGGEGRSRNMRTKPAHQIDWKPRAAASNATTVTTRVASMCTCLPYELSEQLPLQRHRSKSLRAPAAVHGVHPPTALLGAADETGPTPD